MSLTAAKQAINRNNLMSLNNKRTLREVADQLGSGTTTNTAGIAEINAGGPIEAVTAIAGGGTTGLISADTRFAVITSSGATLQVSLPAATNGKIIYLYCGTNGCELISAVAADKVNNVVVGATNEAALVAATMYKCVYGPNGWVMTGLTNLGAVEAPVVPNAL